MSAPESPEHAPSDREGDGFLTARRREHSSPAPGRFIA